MVSNDIVLLEAILTVVIVVAVEPVVEAVAVVAVVADAVVIEEVNVDSSIRLLVDGDSSCSTVIL